MKASHLWQAWKRGAHRVADLQVRGLLALFYYTLLAPFALLVRFRAPLGKNRGAGWAPAPEPGGSEEQRAQEQF